MKIKAWHIVVVIAALVVAGGAAAWVNWDVIVTALEGNHTREITRSIIKSQDIAVAYIEAKNKAVRTEVRTIVVETRRKVDALSDDAVADGLNHEIALWRGVEGGSGGVDE